MALALPALLCFGLSVDSAAQRQPGVLLRPVLWAEPRPVVPRGRPVTLWCEGDPEAQEYRLLRKDGRVRWFSRSPDKPGSRAAFFIPSMTQGKAGRYQCIYRSPAGWSDFSEPLRLVVTENASAAVPPAPPGPRPDHRVHNLVRVGLGLLVLMALVWIVAQGTAVDCGHRRRKTTQQARDGCQEPWCSPGGRGLDLELGEP
ncbi:leukocyte immunoglobulin-like receptor subfamily A member 6 isoform 2-T2 [Thomomys bottae]